MKRFCLCCPCGKKWPPSTLLLQLIALTFLCINTTQNSPFWLILFFFIASFGANWRHSGLTKCAVLLQASVCPQSVARWTFYLPSIQEWEGNGARVSSHFLSRAICVTSDPSRWGMMRVQARPQFPQHQRDVPRHSNAARLWRRGPGLTDYTILLSTSNFYNQGRITLLPCSLFHISFAAAQLRQIVFFFEGNLITVPHIGESSADILRTHQRIVSSVKPST